MAKNKDTSPGAASATATPLEWAEKLGHFRNGLAWDWRYAAADQLHGWGRSAHHFQSEARKLTISQVDYEEALKAAAKFPAVGPHPAALTTLLQEKYKAFDPEKLGRKNSEKPAVATENGAR
jgi:hypothetical protein